MRQHAENEVTLLNFTVIALCISHSFQENKCSPVRVSVAKENMCVQVLPPACMCTGVCMCLCVCVPLCTLAVIIVSNNPNEERGTGCVQSSNYKLIS